MADGLIADQPVTTNSLRLTALESQVRRIPVPASAKSGPNFLRQSITVLPLTAAVVTWTTFNAAQVIPAGATAAIVETEWSMSSPDQGDVDAYIKFRRNLDSITLIGSRGRASGNSDNIAGANQLIVPISPNRSFDYMIDFPGFNNQATIRLVGYYA